MPFITIYITHPNKETAEKIAQHLLKNKLVACANIFAIQSAYWWQNEIAQEGEYVSLVKSIPEKWEQIVKEVNKEHPYEVPCIMKWEVTANAAYEEWIKKSVS